MANYDFKYPGAAIDAILDTAYDLQNAGYIFRGLASEYSNTPTERSWVLAGEGETGHGFTSPIPKGYIGVCVFNGTSWTGKLLKCVSIDSTPTNGSTNAVSSGGAHASISQLVDTVNEALDNFTFTDTTPSAFLGDYITEKVSTTDGGIERILTFFTILAATTSKAGLLSAADKAKLDALWSSGYQFAGIATPSTTPISTTSKIFYIATEVGTYFNAVTVTNGINIIYRSGDAWSVAQVVGIDNEPTAGSDRLVKSGGVFGELALGAVYDVSAKNPTAGPNSNGKWESLSALLSDANLNTLIPTSVRKGGMSIKYVQSSDNKYVQYRLMLSTFTAAQFTNVTNWQGVDDEPTVGSENLAKSGGILNKIIEISDKSIKPVSNILRNGVKRDAILESSWENGTLDNEGQPSGNATIRLRSKNFIPMSYKEIPTVVYDTNNCGISIYMYDENYTFIESTLYLSAGAVDIDEDTAYVKFLIKSNPDGSDLDPSAVDTYGIHVVCDTILEDYLTKSLIYSPFFRPLFTVDDLVDGTILDNGDEDNRKERKKNASYLPINPYHRFAIIYGNDLWELSPVYYDADRNFLGVAGYYPAGIFDPGYKAAAYIRFVFRYKPNPNIEVPAGAMDKFAVSVCDMDDEGAKWLNDLKVTLSTLKSHVDTVTQEGGRYDIFPQNFINGTIDGEGNIAPSFIRAVSGFVKVNPNTRYALEQIEPTEKTLDCSFGLYNENKEFITWITYKGTHAILDTLNAEYIRALLMYTPDGQDINPNQFFPLSLKAVDVKKSATGYFVPYPDSWQFGSINNEGEPGPYVPYRIRTKDFISIEGGKSYVFNYPDGAYSVDIYMYDENFNYIGDTLYIPNGGMAYLNDNVKYCKMIIKPNPDGSTIDIDEVVTSGISVNIADDDVEEVAELAKLNVGLWNIGLLNYGVPVDGRWGIPDDQVAEKLPGVKNIITELNGDITFICEYSNHVDRSYTIDSYDTIFKHFYPYRYMVGEPWMSVFSKYKLFVKMERNVIELIDADIYPYDLSGRPIVYGYIIVGGQKVGIMCCHLSPYSSDRRIKEATRICTLMEEYDRCIIAGDLNSDPGAEGFERDMKPFRDAGYEFANGGYWGYKNTYNPNYPPERGGGQMYIDNILTRGIVIDNYTIGNDMSVSDHLPVRSELSVFVSEE